MLRRACSCAGNTAGFRLTAISFQLRMSATAPLHKILALNGTAPNRSAFVELAPVFSTRDSVFETFTIAIPADIAPAGVPRVCADLVAIFAPGSSTYVAADVALQVASRYGTTGTMVRERRRHQLQLQLAMHHDSGASCPRAVY